MNGLPYYKAYPRDFIEGTIGMPLELKGCYRVLLDLIYMQGGELPDDPRYISGLLGCSVRAWKKYRDQLLGMGKINAEKGVISNFRASFELETLAKLQEVKRENRAGFRKNKDLQKRPSDHTEPEPDKSVETNVSTPVHREQREPDRFEEFWAIYPHRGGRKAGKAAAQKKWGSARSRGISQQTMIDGAQRARNDPQVMRGYARNPETWINQAGWEDEFQPGLRLEQGGQGYGGYVEERRAAGEERLRRVVTAAARGTSGKDWG